MYNGSAWNDVAFTETKGIAVSSLTPGARYDLFGIQDGSDFGLEFSSAWSNATTRAMACSWQDGMFCKTGDKSRLVLASIQMGPANGSIQSFTPSYSTNVIGNPTNWSDGSIDRNAASYTDSGTSTSYWNMDLGSAKAIDRIRVQGVGILYPSSSCTIKAQYSDNGSSYSDVGGGGTQTVTLSDNSPPWKTDYTLQFDAPSTHRYFRVEMVVANASRIYVSQIEIYSASVPHLKDLAIGLRSVGNVFNAVPTSVQTQNTNVSWDWQTANWQEFNGGSGQVRGEFILPIASNVAACFDNSYATYNTTAAQVDNSNGTTAADCISVKARNASEAFTWAGMHGIPLAAGYHYITQCEYGRTSSTTYGVGRGCELIVNL